MQFIFPDQQAQTLTAVMSFSLKNSILAKKIGDEHLKIFTPSGS